MAISARKIRSSRTRARGVALWAAALLVASAACSDSTGGSPPDTTAPAVRIDTPVNNSLTAAGNVTVTGVATDDAGVSRVSYRVNGGAETDVPITAGASVAFSFAVALASGDNTVQVLAYDLAGNTSSASVGTSLDNTAPAVTLTAPLGNAVGIAPTATVQGTAADARGVTRITYQVNGGAETVVAISAGPSVTFNASVPLGMGANTITVNGYDGVGNRTQVLRAVERRAAGVALLSLRDVNGAAIADATIEATASATGTPLHRASGPSNAVVFAPGGTFGVENLSNGDYRIHLPTGASYSLSLSRPSFLPLVYHNVAVQQESPVQLEPVRLVPVASAGTGIGRVQITDAFSGNALAGVALRVRGGVNATTGTVAATGTTDNAGAATFGSLAAGTYTVEMSRQGYAGGFFTMTIVGGRRPATPAASPRW